ncbi:recombinase family protein [Streptosporangium roseum]|uniref:recombinase family protein n=1 Tax=Streptosporangium roseum TaxID=2001 RepID=UPI00332B0C70
MYGYYGVSTADQNPDHQIDALQRVGVAAGNIFGDTASGAKASRPASATAKRPQRRTSPQFSDRFRRPRRCPGAG